MTAQTYAEEKINDMASRLERAVRYQRPIHELEAIKAKLSYWQDQLHNPKPKKGVTVRRGKKAGGRKGGIKITRKSKNNG